MNIQLQEVSKTFGFGHKAKQAVKEVSFLAESGEILAIVGPNGAGKTTITRILLGLLQADSGTILVDGKPTLLSSEAFRHSIGFLAEERSYQKIWKVKDLLPYFGMLKGMPEKKARQEAAELAERFELTPFWNQESKTLSKGLCQRVQLVASFLHHPKLIVLDEPFSGLDPIAANILRGYLRELCSKGRNIIICSHQMAEIQLFCDRILMLFEGEVVLSGDLADICSPKDEQTIVITDAPPLGELRSASRITSSDRAQVITLAPEKHLHDLLAELAESQISFRDITRPVLSLEEVFVRTVRKKQHELS